MLTSPAIFKTGMLGKNQYNVTGDLITGYTANKEGIMPVKTLKTVPYITTFLLENRRVREYEFFLKPGERTEMHSHPDYLIYVLCDFRLRIKMADDKTEEVDFKAGQSSYKLAQTHSVENIGKTDARALIIELKD